MAQADLDTETLIDFDSAARSAAHVMVTARCGADRAAWARTIHARSPRRQGPFVAVRGSTAARVRGALDVAVWLEQAAGGTLFIDHVGQMSAYAQVQLLLYLMDQEQQHRCLGSRRIDDGVRVIAASDRSLRADLAAGAFCEELFHRLSAIHIDHAR